MKPLRGGVIKVPGWAHEFLKQPLGKFDYMFLDICSCICQSTRLHACTVGQTAVGCFTPMQSGSPFSEDGLA